MNRTGRPPLPVAMPRFWHEVATRLAHAIRQEQGTLLDLLTIHRCPEGDRIAVDLCQQFVLACIHSLGCVCSIGRMDPGLAVVALEMCPEARVAWLAALHEALVCEPECGGR